MLRPALGSITRTVAACTLLLFALTLSWRATAFSATPGPASLVYFSQKGCPACMQWDRDIGRVYAKTDEAKVLPLRQVDIDAPRPADLRNVQGIHYTPTFVVMRCGHEVTRIIGYTSDFQFWGLLDEALKGLPKAGPCPAPQ